MKTLLRIDTSTRGEQSHSIDLANGILKKIENEYGVITKRDLTKTDLPHVTQEFIEAMYTHKEKRTKRMNETLATSDAIIQELKDADAILISVPMFNFGVPSLFKAYIDHITRVGETFAMGEYGMVGLLKNKKVFIAASYGADFSNMKAMDFVEPYMKSIFGFLGIEDVTYLAIEGTSTLNEEAIQKKKEELLKTL